MQIITRSVSGIPRSPHFGDGACLLDITTEGRYWRTSRLISASVICLEQGEAVEKTWISEKEADEYDILFALSRLLPEIKTLFTFNGTSFDLPHLAKKFAAYRLPDPVTGKDHHDLYLKLKDLNAVLPLKSHRLTDYLGCLSPLMPGVLSDSCAGRKTNTDENGKASGTTAGSEEASDFRENASAASGTPADSEEASNLRERPNASAASGAASSDAFPLDDACGALYLTVLLDLLDFMKGGFTAGSAISDPDCLTISLTPDQPLPLSLSVSDGPFNLDIRPEGARVTAALFSGRLRRYFTNVADYDYLPLEGYAVHRSVSAYVGRSRKEKAVRDNCFTLFPCTDAFAADPAALKKYAASVLAFMLTRPADA